MLIKQMTYPSGGTGGATQPFTQWETVDLVFTNVQGATITTGLPVAFTTTAASVDGISGVLPATNNVLTFAGIALSDVPNNGVGLVRAYGLCNSVAIFATGTSGSVAAGVALGPGAGSLGVNSTGVLDTFGPVINLVSYGAVANSAGGAYTRAFVRAL